MGLSREIPKSLPRLPTVKPRQVIKVLERAGFENDHQTGKRGDTLFCVARSTAAAWSYPGTAVISDVDLR